MKILFKIFILTFIVQNFSCTTTELSVEPKTTTPTEKNTDLADFSDETFDLAKTTWDDFDIIQIHLDRFNLNTIGYFGFKIASEDPISLAEMGNQHECGRLSTNLDFHLCWREPIDIGYSIIIDGLSGTLLLNAESVFMGYGGLIFPKTLIRDDNLKVTSNVAKEPNRKASLGWISDSDMEKAIEKTLRMNAMKKWIGDRKYDIVAYQHEYDGSGGGSNRGHNIILFLRRY